MSIQQTSEGADLIEFLQMAKLVGTSSLGQSNQGIVSLSADGNTAVVGGPNDNDGTGAIWIFTKSDISWTQQGGKLTGSDCIGASMMGQSVAISADGNTVIAGGPGDGGFNPTGAAWIFTRTNGNWSQQAKLVGSNFIGASGQGIAVAISADGNTCAVGGSDDDGGVGATWIFSRAGTSWTQVGNKLIGSGYSGNAGQGSSLALSANATTLVVGSTVQTLADAPVWVFVNSSGWQQQGNYLTASDSVNNPNGQNTSLSISADGQTFVLGENQDNGQVGAAWIFACNAGVWSQQGYKLIGSGAVGNASQGCSVAISGDGKTILVGGDTDNGNLDTGWVGAAWVYQCGDGRWWQIGNKLVANNTNGKASQGVSVALSEHGNTVLLGGCFNSGGVGAAWVFLKAYTPNSP
jgi:hypothetical protein